MAADHPESDPESDLNFSAELLSEDESEIAQLEGETLELADLLNTALDKGVILHGDVTIAVADIDLVKLNLGLLLGAIDTVQRHTGAGRIPGGQSASPVGDANRQAGTGRARPTLAGIFGPPLLDPVPPSQSTASARPTTGSTAQSSTASTKASASSAGPGSAPQSPPTTSVSSNPETSLNAVAQGLPQRINADATGVESGLARLVLTLIEVLRKVLEHQAVRRMDGGKLSAAEIERLGLALSRLNDRMDELKNVFGLTDDDLHIDLGPLGRVR